MAIFDSSGRLTECSAEFAQLLKENPEKLLGRTYEELPFSSESPALPLVRKAQETGRGASQHLAVGEAFLRVSAQPLLTREGSAPRVAVTLMALTQEQVPEERIRQLETKVARFHSLFDNLPMIFWVTRADGVPQFLNRHWYEFTGKSPTEEAGNSWHEVIHPEDRPSLVQLWTQSVSSGKPYEMECRYHRHDGAWLWHKVRGYPLRDAEGNIVSWLGCSMDIQELRLAVEQADAERRNAEQVRAALDTFFDAVPAGMALFDEQLRYLRINRSLAEMNGLSVEGHIGHTPRELFPKLDPHPEDLFRRVLDTGETVTFESTGTSRASDEVSTWLACTAPVRSPVGQKLGVVIVIMDISQRKRAEAERDRLIAALERSNRELDQFAYVASHDLKAPLRGIANLAQWIGDDLKEIMTEETQGQMKLLTGRVHRMEALINGILAYSRAGRVQSQPENVDVGALLNETIELLSPASPAAIHVQGHMPHLVSERVPLQQVFLNLMNNALKHALRKDVLIQVRCSEVGETYEFAISDNGPGIAPEYHERIWGIFQTLRARDEVEGTGIGLSVVKKIVEARGGSVRLESAVGQGATFFFTWPKVPAKK
ncbi:PAS domain-containing sensor histidine kinase [Hyalangium versicolor]|uniref:PAS domain-containing sensor histidine kinase n=1 Tax=Hyalangium versicolor TaxID=2861190 RepID=UPI0021062B90|nr:PAS domain-containing sensor histidine kinase [Hyalangium versicolor]